MEVLSLKYSLINKKLLFLFVFLDLLIIASILLDHYISVLVFLVIPAFFVLNFWDVRITLWFLIAFSILVAYQLGVITAAMMITLNLAYIFVCLSVFFQFCLGKFEIKKTKLNLPIAVFLIMAFAQALRGIFVSHPIKWLAIEFLAYSGFGLFFLVTSLCQNREMIKKFFQLLLVVAYYQAIIGLWNFFQVGHRIGGYLFGGAPSLMALILLNLAFYSKQRSQKLTYVFLSLPLVLHLVFSFTRGFWFGFICALLFSYSIYLLRAEYSVKTRLLRFFKGGIVFISIMLALLVGVQGFLFHENLLSQVSQRFMSSFGTRLGAGTISNFSRLVEYKECLEKIKEKPLLGYGVGYKLSFMDPVFQKRITSGIVHQFYLMITLKMGLIGLLVFIWIFYVFLREGLKESKKIEDGYYKGLSYGFIANAIELLVINFTNHPLATVDNTFYLAFAMAGVIIINSKRS